MRHRFRTPFAGGLASLLLAGSLTAAQQTTTPATGQPATTPSAAQPATTPSNYVIGAMDRLRISVWNQTDISGEYVVERDGSFTFPHVGRVTASGFTILKLETELRRLLADGFFKDPQVTISVIEYGSKRIFVIGEVRTPGTYSVMNALSLVEALARAGSTTQDAADHALIIRSAGAQGPLLPGQDQAANVTRVDLRRLRAGEMVADAIVHDGDTVFVPRAATVFVYGQVMRPGSYPIGEETTVRQALSLAGGLSEYGSANRVRILRVVDGKEKEIPVKLNDLVRPGDTIVVPERYF